MAAALLRAGVSEAAVFFSEPFGILENWFSEEADEARTSFAEACWDSLDDVGTSLEEACWDSLDCGGAISAWVVFWGVADGLEWEGIRENDGLGGLELFVGFKRALMGDSLKRKTWVVLCCWRVAP